VTAAFVDGVPEWSAWLTSAVAGLVAVRWLFRRVRAAVRAVTKSLAKIDRLDELATYELTHNGGGSIKDAVALVPAMKAQLDAHVAASEALIRQGQATEKRIERRLSEQDAAQTALTEALRAMADAQSVALRSTPPEGD
jgi:hypothetical protein